MISTLVSTVFRLECFLILSHTNHFFSPRFLFAPHFLGFFWVSWKDQMNLEEFQIYKKTKTVQVLITFASTYNPYYLPKELSGWIFFPLLLFQRTAEKRARFFFGKNLNCNVWKGFQFFFFSPLIIILPPFGARGNFFGTFTASSLLNCATADKVRVWTFLQLVKLLFVAYFQMDKNFE